MIILTYNLTFSEKLTSTEILTLKILDFGIFDFENFLENFDLGISDNLG